MQKPIAITALLELAHVAVPPAKPSRSRWAKFVPVVEQLKANGFNLRRGIEWLVEQGQIPAGQEALAYKSIRQLIERRNKKKARAAA